MKSGFVKYLPIKQTSYFTTDVLHARYYCSWLMANNDCELCTHLICIQYSVLWENNLWSDEISHVYCVKSLSPQSDFLRTGFHLVLDKKALSTFVYLLYSCIVLLFVFLLLLNIN